MYIFLVSVELIGRVRYRQCKGFDYLSNMIIFRYLHRGVV